MQVKSVAECSKGSILQYFRPSLSYHLSLRSLFCLVLSGRFTQVLLDVQNHTWTPCPLGNLSCIFVVCWFFSKSTPPKNSFRNTIWVSNRLDPDRAQCFVRSDLVTICFQRLSQGSHGNSKTQFHDFSMIFHDQRCYLHDYLMHGLQPPLLAASPPRWA